MKPTQEQLDRLPKWAKEHFAKLQYERDSAVEQLNSLHDEQTPTDIWVAHIEYSTGEFKERKQYIGGTRIEAECKGVHLNVNLTERGLELGWGPAGSGSPIGDMCFIPTSYQQARITNLAYDTDEFQRLSERRERIENRDND
jgi:hypothetical protein